MVNPYDTIHDLNAYCEGLERRLSTIKAQCAEWGRVFGHLGDTPDECGNAIIAKRDELEARCATLADELRLAVRQNSRDKLMTAEELRSCEAILEKLK